jgi:hypothetical protein
MKESRWQVCGAVIGAMLWAVPMTATVKTGTEAQKPSALSAMVARSAWPPETLTGKIMNVDASRRLVVVEGSGKVLYDMRVTPGTRILAGKQPVKLDNLNSDIDRQVTVRFTPERSGDFAQMIQIQK